MSNFAVRSGFAFVVVALCLVGRPAHGQSAPMRYWTPDWLGFGGTDHQALTRIPDSRVVVLHDAGHLLNIEKADVFNDLVRRFLLDRDSDGGVND